MPIHSDWVPMITGMEKTYCTDKSEKVCYDLAGGSKKCVCKKAWSVFYATCKNKGWDYTKPRPKKVSETAFREAATVLIGESLDWYLSRLRIGGYGDIAGIVASGAGAGPSPTPKPSPKPHPIIRPIKPYPIKPPIKPPIEKEREEQIAKKAEQKAKESEAQVKTPAPNGEGVNPHHPRVKEMLRVAKKTRKLLYLESIVEWYVEEQDKKNV